MTASSAVVYVKFLTCPFGKFPKSSKSIHRVFLRANANYVELEPKLKQAYHDNLQATMQNHKPVTENGNILNLTYKVVRMNRNCEMSRNP